MTQPQIELIAINKAVEIIKSHIDSYSADVSEDKQERYLSIRLALGAVLQEIEQLPRSSPQVAPGLRDAWNAFEEKAIASNGYFDLYANRWPEYDVLRDAIAAAQVQPDTGLREAIRGAIDKYNNQFYPASSRMTPGTVEDLSDIAANIAAAQGGQVDRSALNDIIGKLVEAVKSTKESFGEVKVGKWGDGSDCALKHTFSFVEIVKQANALDRFDFNSAVPSAPGGAERVDVAGIKWEIGQLTNRLMALEYVEGITIPSDVTDVLVGIQRAIEALGTPQGSDSLTDTTRLEK